MNCRTVKNRNARIIIFTRFPESGQAKTRLVPFLGPHDAANFHRAMTQFTVRQARQTGVSVQISFAGGDADRMRAWLGDDCEYSAQADGDLGMRMERAFADAFEDGARKVLIVGSDCPDNRSSNMLAALAMLEKTSCVIGPAADGGYYLIGLRRPRPELFQGITWGSESVFRQTVSKIDAFRLLPVLADVDEPQDIPPKISVIIPALNEESQIAGAVQSAFRGFNVETMVVDGRSRDNTQASAAQAGAHVVMSDRGRAVQMNCGAAQATGDIVLFLHADSVLPPEWDRHVRTGMKQPENVLGYFHFSIKGSFFGKHLVEFGTNLRARCFRKPYGDQALFLRRDTFFELGGFPEVPILEDCCLVRQAGRRGSLYCVNDAVLTSGRRWLKYGVIRTTLINQAVLLAARRGTDLHALRNAYDNGMDPKRIFLNSAQPK